MDTTTIAEKFFSSQESRALHECSKSERERRFFEYWTLKEAFVKARGFGIVDSLDQFAFDIVDNAIGITVDSCLGEDPAQWQFAMFDVKPYHVVAICVDTAGGPLSLHAQRFVPTI